MKKNIRTLLALVFVITGISQSTSIITMEYEPLPKKQKPDLEELQKQYQELQERLNHLYTLLKKAPIPQKKFEDYVRDNLKLPINSLLKDIQSLRGQAQQLDNHYLINQLNILLNVFHYNLGHILGIN